MTGKSLTKIKEEARDRSEWWKAVNDITSIWAQIDEKRRQINFSYFNIALFYLDHKLNFLSKVTKQGTQLFLRYFCSFSYQHLRAKHNGLAS